MIYILLIIFAVIVIGAIRLLANAPQSPSRYSKIKKVEPQKKVVTTIRRTIPMPEPVKKATVEKKVENSIEWDGTIVVHPAESEPTLHIASQASVSGSNHEADVPHSMFPEPTASEKPILEKEKKYRKMATALKKEKKYLEAVECLRKAREFQYRTSFYYDIKTLLRVPQYLLLAKANKEAYDEAMAMANFKWKVAGMIEGTMEQTKCQLKIEALSIAHEAAQKLNDETLMNIAGAALKEIDVDEDGMSKALGMARVADIKKQYEKNLDSIGHDVGTISDDGCDCLPRKVLKKWNGKYISVLGRVATLPTIDDAFADGLFCSWDCGHRIDPVIPEFDKIPAWLGKVIGRGD